MTRTSIAWTDVVWNPVTGCTKVSAGCGHCYAETYWHWFHLQLFPFDRVLCHENRVENPLHWRKPRRVFVNSMSDLFHPDVPDTFIARVFATIRSAREHTFQILTKRPERMRRWFSQCGNGGALGWITHNNTEPERAYRGTGIIVGDQDRWPLPNVWLGVSVENQATADERIPLLLQTPAAVRFVSCEPLLGPIDLTRIDTTSDTDPGYSALELRDDDEGDLVETLDWVIVGGESGPKARPCDVAWMRSIVGQCDAASMPCFVKQLGAFPVVPAGRLRYWEWGGAIKRSDPKFSATDPLHQATAPWRVHLKDRKGGDPAEWPEDLRCREFPAIDARSER